MGSSCSSVHFIPNNAISGQSYHILEVCRMIQISSVDLDRIWTAFLKLNPNPLGQIKIPYILVSNEIEITPLNVALFCFFDVDIKELTIGFESFLLSIWNILTLSESQTIEFSLQCLDLKGNRLFFPEDVHYFLEAFWGDKKVKDNKLIANSTDELKYTNEKQAEFVDLVRVVDGHPILMYPLFHAQLALKKFIGGARFWNRMKFDRETTFSTRDIFDICEELCDEMNQIQFFEALHSQVMLPQPWYVYVQKEKLDYQLKRKKDNKVQKEEDKNTREKHANDMRKKRGIGHEVRRRLSLASAGGQDKYQKALKSMRDDVPKQFTNEDREKPSPSRTQGGIRDMARRVSRLVVGDRNKPNRYSSDNHGSGTSSSSTSSSSGGGIIRRISQAIVRKPKKAKQYQDSAGDGFSSLEEEGSPTSKAKQTPSNATATTTTTATNENRSKGGSNIIRRLTNMVKPPRSPKRVAIEN